MNCLPLPSDVPCPVCPSWSLRYWSLCSPGAAFEQPWKGPFWLCLRFVSLPCEGCWILAAPSSGLDDVTGGCCTEYCTAHCIALCKGMLQIDMPLAGCGTGALHMASHGRMTRALHGSVARERCMEHCVGTLHRGGKRGSPTTDPIPIPAPAQPQVTVIWLHNGDIVEPDDYNPISAIPNSDWSYQTQVSLLVALVAGDTYTCSVQHVSLQEPLLEDWSEWRGLSPQVSVRGEPGPWSRATRTLLTPFLPPAGYTPLPGDNYPAGNGVPIRIGER
uniref:Immunoglobulin C1-set domain-containing protein n=1 Tax=Anas platyrhynchos platyrhynchos TaxID=8840 RepID=A0A493T4E2_ANAPP